MKAFLELAARLALGLLWLAASAASAVLVYWLYVDPVYGRPWSSDVGALLFAALSVYAAAAWLFSLTDARGPSLDRRKCIRGTALPPQGVDVGGELEPRA